MANGFTAGDNILVTLTLNDSAIFLFGITRSTQIHVTGLQHMRT